MHESKQPPSTNAAPKVRWYRRNGWVTAMVAATLLLGPLLAIPVLLILCTGPVYSGRNPERWDISTKVLVLVFSLLITAFWLFKVAAPLI